MTDLDLIAPEQHTPDGTRPLVVHNPSRLFGHQLQPRQRVSGETLCQVVREAAGLTTEPPPSCLRIISCGDFYLAYLSAETGDETAVYCAPCAIREWSHRDVREATS